MKQPKAKEQLVDALASDLKTRKRELVTLNGLLTALPTPPQGQARAFRRAAVILAYAHWEGFIHHAATCYVAFVAFKNKALAQLIAPFQALSCRSVLAVAAPATKRIGPHLQVVNRLVDRLQHSADLKHEGAIDTESNLTSEVFANICGSIGVDYSAWSGAAPFINDLVKSRCDLAHGGLDDPGEKFAVEAVDFTVRAMDQFSTEILNAVVNNRYLRTTSRAA